MVWRVGVGALLSTADAATDVYVVGTYYSEGLNDKAHLMLMMIGLNIGMQILVVFAQYQKKSWIVKLREVLFCLLCLRPVVDAFRVSTTYEDGELLLATTVETTANKVSFWKNYLRNCILTVFPPKTNL